MAVKPILSLSSSWNSSRHSDGYAMLCEIAELGFSHVELSHGIRVTLVPGILRALREEVIKVSSVHNFCPLPAGVEGSAPNLFQPTALKAEELEQWFRYTSRSIEFAQQVGAKAIVVHSGSVELGFFDPVKKLETYFDAHVTEALEKDEKLASLRDKALAKMRTKMPPHWTRLKMSLERVRLLALEKDIRIGIENREAADELPLDADFEHLISGLPKPNTVGYWHDAGHAHIKARMGLLDHQQHLEANAERLIGFHLHDVNAEARDHQPVGSGQIDFKMVSSFWRPHHLFIIELSPRVSREGVVESKERVEALLAESPAMAAV